MSYTGKCENCGIEHPSISIMVRKDRGDGILTKRILVFKVCKH